MMLAVAVQPSVAGSLIRRNAFRFEKVMHRYQRALERNPVRTNALSGLALGAVGDIFCQVAVEKKNLETFSFTRLAAFSTFSGFYSATINLYLFNLYPKLLPASLSRTPLREGMASSFLDNCIHSPLLYLPVFYGWMGLSEGESCRQIAHKYVDQLPAVMSTLLIFWMPLQTLNFGYVPRKQRVVFVCGANLVWNCLLDFMHNNQ